MVTGLRIDRRISAGVQLDFLPSIGIMAAQVDKLGLDIRAFKEPLTRAVKQVMIPSIRANFASEGRPSWEPLAEQTLAAREYLGYGDGPILYRTGNLAKRATQFNIWTINPVAASVQRLPADVFYGGIMQAGAEGTASSLGAAAETLSGAGAGLYSSLTAAIASQAKGAGIKKTANIPARRFIMFQDEDIPKIEAVFDKWLDGRVAKAGW
jgi:phage gpG-like protein